MSITSDKLINIENYTMDEIWQKFIIPENKDAYTHEELFSQYVPTVTIFEGVPLEKAYEFISDIYNLSAWTMSLRNPQPFKDDIYEAKEIASPTGKVYIRCIPDKNAHTIELRCNHSNPDDLWMAYKWIVVDANEVIGRPGSAFIWIVFIHEKVKNDPSLSMGYKYMYTAHRIEAGNLKKILESRFNNNL